ncbi:helix-turn-helix transcriptional regulator [Lactobacillus crispatus]|uniref:helix-turn-helix domain-containing protein n=1 Tax=Lactobacillus crispatus TaxID=47770 RepID=UPI0015ECB935|nr:helix-turn-helix transcriptional regulator [Lactobacillus crispatus]MBA2916529.1 helix-turn-helix transcriptional regulator [Lactobacillus crispatus]
MSVFNKRLQKMRLLKGWNKSTTAQKLGISAQRYSNWEYGPREPDYELLIQIADLFATTTDYLTGRIDNPNLQPTERTSNDLDKMIEKAHYFDGIPINDNDREIVCAFLKGRFSKR